MSKQVQIYIDENYFDLVPRPTKEQRKALKESIKEEGQKEPIILDSTGRVIDGHTRFEICQELHLKPKYVIREFKTDDEKKRYAIIVNLKRRHLNEYQIFELMYDDYQRIKKSKEEGRGVTIWKKRRGEIPKQSYRQKYDNTTIMELSRMTGVGIHKLEECRFLKLNADPKIQKQLRDGTMGTAKAYHIVKIKSEPKSSLKGKTYRSRMGIVFDIIRAILDSQQSCRVSHICRMSNLSHYACMDYLKPLIKFGLIKEEKNIIRGKYYSTQSDFISYSVSHKGHEYYQKCKELYSMLPDELNDITPLES